jgi:hypothetical protein
VSLFRWKVLLCGNRNAKTFSAASAVIFNLPMFATHHKICNTTHSMIVTAPATLPSAYSVGIISGVFFTTHTFQRALTFLGGYRLVGGTAALAMMMLTVIWLERIGCERIQE